MSLTAAARGIFGELPTIRQPGQELTVLPRLAGELNLAPEGARGFALVDVVRGRLAEPDGLVLFRNLGLHEGALADLRRFQQFGLGFSGLNRGRLVEILEEAVGRKRADLESCPPWYTGTPLAVADSLGDLINVLTDQPSPRQDQIDALGRLATDPSASLEGLRSWPYLYNRVCFLLRRDRFEGVPMTPRTKRGGLPVKVKREIARAFRGRAMRLLTEIDCRERSNQHLALRVALAHWTERIRVKDPDARVRLPLNEAENLLQAIAILEHDGLVTPDYDPIFWLIGLWFAPDIVAPYVARQKKLLMAHGQSNPLEIPEEHVVHRITHVLKRQLGWLHAGNWPYRDGQRWVDERKEEGSDIREFWRGGTGIWFHAIDPTKRDFRERDFNCYDHMIVAEVPEAMTYFFRIRSTSSRPAYSTVRVIPGPIPPQLILMEGTQAEVVRFLNSRPSV